MDCTSRYEREGCGFNPHHGFHMAVSSNGRTRDFQSRNGGFNSPYRCQDIDASRRYCDYRLSLNMALSSRGRTLGSQPRDGVSITLSAANSVSPARPTENVSKYSQERCTRRDTQTGTGAVCKTALCGFESHSRLQ